jgi:nucleotide-binding universal stress UspA family protein
MRRFKNILFSPLGERDNPAALRRVARIAGQNSGRLTLLGVAPEPPMLQRVLQSPDLVDSLIRAERAELDKKLRRWAGHDATGAECIVEVGDPALTVIRHVITNHHDLVVVTTDEDREDHATIRRLLRKCPCPVWVIRPTRASTQKVLAAINPEPDEAELNRTILELASSMVRISGGELHVIHAWELYGESTMRTSSFMHIQSSDLEDMVERAHTKHEEALNDALDAAGVADEPWQLHVVKGHTADVIPAAVTKYRINLLVMGTVARTGIGGLVMGNTAERVLDDVSRSFIAVKPPGFVSPIQLPAS